MTAREKPTIHPSATRSGAVDFSPQLASGEVLTGTPTVVEVGSSDLAIASKSINAAEIEILGATVAIGKAVTFTVTGALRNTSYTLRVTCGTDATPAQTVAEDCVLKGEDVPAGS